MVPDSEEWEWEVGKGLYGVTKLPMCIQFANAPLRDLKFKKPIQGNSSFISFIHIVRHKQARGQWLPHLISSPITSSPSGKLIVWAHWVGISKLFWRGWFYSLCLFQLTSSWVSTPIEKDTTVCGGDWKNDGPFCVVVKYLGTVTLEISWKTGNYSKNPWFKGKSPQNRMLAVCVCCCWLKMKWNSELRRLGAVGQENCFSVPKSES